MRKQRNNTRARKAAAVVVYIEHPTTGRAVALPLNTWPASQASIILILAVN